MDGIQAEIPFGVELNQLIPCIRAGAVSLPSPLTTILPFNVDQHCTSDEAPCLAYVGVRGVHHQGGGTLTFSSVEHLPR